MVSNLILTFAAAQGRITNCCTVHPHFRQAAVQLPGSNDYSSEFACLSSHFHQQAGSAILVKPIMTHLAPVHPERVVLPRDKPGHGDDHRRHPHAAQGPFDGGETFVLD